MVTIVQNNIWNICTEVAIWGKYIYLIAIEKTDWYCTKIVIDRQARKRCNNYTLIDNERIFIESELDEKNKIFVFLIVPRCHHNAMLYTLHMSLGISVLWILYSVLNMQFYIAYSGRGSAGNTKGAPYTEMHECTNFAWHSSRSTIYYTLNTYGKIYRKRDWNVFKENINILRYTTTYQVINKLP